MNRIRAVARALLRRNAPGVTDRDGRAAEETLLAAFDLHRSGRLSEAISLYRQAVELDPASDKALNLLGVALCGQGKRSEGEDCFRRAIAVNAANVEALNNLASALKDRGALSEAEVTYRRAIALQSHFAPAWNNLGSIYLGLKRPDDAERCFRSAIQVDCASAEAHSNLGMALRLRGRFSEAEAAFRAAIAANPAVPEAWCGLGDVLPLRGRLDEAETCCLKALELRPGYADARSNLATIAKLRGRLDVARAYCDEVLRTDPNHVGALINLGNVAAARADYHDAAKHYGIARAVAPDDPVVRFNLGTTLLMLGDYPEGFALYESRFDALPRAPTSSIEMNERLGQRPRWRGEPLAGRRLLVWAEQGYGDSIMMLRYLPELRERGVESITVVCQEGLVRLIRAMSVVDSVVAVDQVDAALEFDTHCPMMSFPAAFGTRLETIPSGASYLAVPQHMINAWSERLPRSRSRIGIVWAGDRNLRDDAARSISLEQFAPLFAIEGVAFVSLQKGEAAAEWRRSGRDSKCIDACADFLDTAALVTNLDLVISVDTAVAHLAAALGRPVWLLNRFSSEWRWGIDAQSSTWYPSMRVFRQPVAGAWTDVIARIVAELRVWRTAHDACPAAV